MGAPTAAGATAVTKVPCGAMLVGAAPGTWSRGGAARPAGHVDGVDIDAGATDDASATSRPPALTRAFSS